MQGSGFTMVHAILYFWARRKKVYSILIIFTYKPTIRIGRKFPKVPKMISKVPYMETY
jgi:hypothetical protein